MEHKTTFLPQEFLAQARDGKNLNAQDIHAFINGIKTGATSPAQIGAFVMAVRLSGLGKNNIVDLTCALRDSGDVLRWDLDGPVVDKHSTGGVGDNVSLILAPILAALGAYVPMISGAGLGHTGGTLDKLSSIQGYKIDADNHVFKNVVTNIGCAIIGQTDALAPADKVLYATRSATAAVDSIALITASILSKKLAEGLDALVLDIKSGNGAMMQTKTEAEELASSLVEVARGAGVKTSALITDMNQPLASAAGNSLEVINALNLLKSESHDLRLKDVTLKLCAKLLADCELAVDEQQGYEKAKTVLENGMAAEKFAQMVSALGGPNNILENDTCLPKANIVQDIKAEKSGVIKTIDTRSIGMAVIVLGGGRKKPDDKIDYSTGFDNLAELGTKINQGDILARIHAADKDTAFEASKMLRASYIIENGEK